MTEFVLEAVIQPRQTENEGQGADFAGREWDVTIIGPKEDGDLVTVDNREFVRSKNGRLYAVEGIKASPLMWEGAKVYDNHLTDEEFEKRQGMRRVTDEWLGKLVDVNWSEATKKLNAIFKVVDRHLATKLKDAWDLGALDVIGLSIDSFIIPGQEIVFEGNRWPVVEGFKKALSVDLVGDPAAGGGFNRLIAAQTQKGVITDMDEEQIKQLVADGIKDAIPTIAEALAAQEPQQEAEQEQPPSDEQPEEAQPQDEAESEEESGEEEAVETEPKQAPQEAEEPTQETLEARLARLEKQQRETEAKAIINKRLKEAKLAPELEQVVRDAFKGRRFKEPELNKFVANLKKAQAKLEPDGHVKESGGQRGNSMSIFGEDDKHAMMFTRKILQATGRHSLASIEQNQEHQYIKPRMFEAYKAWTKAGKPNLNYNGRLSELLRIGFLNGEWSLDKQRYTEALTLATVIKNTVNIVTALDYMGANNWYESIVDVLESDNPIDTYTLARLFGAEALDVVAKGAPYTEMTLQDEEETASHVKQGNYIAVHLEDLLADKISYFSSLPSRIADAWSLTLSAKVAGVFTTNTAAGPVLSDSGALFNATAVSTAGGHANLLTAGLDYTAYDAVITAMTNQTRRPLGAGQKITNMGPFYLVHPNALRSTANILRNTDHVPGTSNFQISNYGPSGNEGQRPILVNVPDWTDANDWAVVARYNGMSPIKLIFPPGMLTPEIYVADSELAGAMFTNDTLRYKIRMMTYRFSATYDVAPVTDWRLMHKNNV